jgi:multimeric flavodoxin WrbA
MKVTAFVGSARKKHTYSATEQFMKNLQLFGDINYEIVALKDYKIEICRGCKLCMNKGEELCPLMDDRNKLIDKITNSDGVVFASPNYSFNVSGLMKVFLDRLGFLFHRPDFFGKTCTSIVVQGFYGGKKINEYLDFAAKGLGFDVVKGCCLNSLEPMTESDQKKFEKVIYKQSKKFYSSLMKKEYPVPSLFQLMVFRMSRTSIRLVLDETWRDFQYYRKKGWFKTDYYFPIQLNPFKKVAANFFDFLFKRMYEKKATMKLPDSSS